MLLIAYAGITVNDVVYVVDTGRMKETQYDAAKKMATLVDTWTSKANGTQRKGRAGRVSEGQCFRLYTRHTYQHILPAQQLPEIHRSPLEQLCLQIKTLADQMGFARSDVFAASPLSSSSSSSAAVSSVEAAGLTAHMRTMKLTEDSKSDAPAVSAAATAAGAAGAAGGSAAGGSQGGKGAKKDKKDRKDKGAPANAVEPAAAVASAGESAPGSASVSGGASTSTSTSASASSNAAVSASDRDKSGRVSMIERVMMATIEPPPLGAVRAAISILTDIGALDEAEHLTSLGAHLSKMPVDVRIGKMLIYGAMFRCVTPVVAIAALFSNKSPFVAPLEVHVSVVLCLRLHLRLPLATVFAFAVTVLSLIPSRWRLLLS